MKYTYTNATGTTQIEVDEQFYNLLIAMDREEYNSDRKHSRRYPVALDDADYEGGWFADKRGNLSETETVIDTARALASLTELQRICFTEVCLNERTRQRAADQLGISRQMVDAHIKAAKKKLKKYF